MRGDDDYCFSFMPPKLDAFIQYFLCDVAASHLTGTSGGAGGTTNAQFPINRKSLEERGVSAQQVIERLRNGTPQIPKAMMFLMVDQDIYLGSPFRRSEHEVVLRSDSLDALKLWS